MTLIPLDYQPRRRREREHAFVPEEHLPAISPFVGASLLFSIALLGLIALYVSPIVAGILYLIGYIALAWSRPDLAVLVMFAMAPFPYAISGEGSGIAMAMGEISLALAAPVFMLRHLSRGRPLTPYPILIPVLLYFSVCLVSTLMSGFSSSFGVAMAQMVVYMVVSVVVFASFIADREIFITGLYGLLGSTVFLAIAVTVTRDAYAFGVNKNANGTNIGYALIVCMALWVRARSRRARGVFLFAAGILSIGLVITVSRGAWLGVAAGLMVLLAIRRQYKVLWRVVPAMVVMIAIAWIVLPDTSKDYATDMSGDSHNVVSRVESFKLAMSLFQQNPLLGMGVGLRKQYDATNVFASTLAETGVLGLFTFASIFVAIGFSVFKARRYATPRHPLFLFVELGAALSACELVHGSVDHYWTRILLVPWAAVGMMFFALKIIMVQAALRRRGL